MKPTIKRLLDQRDALNKKIEEYRDKCIHSNMVSNYKSNTGNYDPSNDSWWVENHCQDCGKFWVSDVYKERY